MVAAIATAVLPGCSGRGTYITGGPSSSQLKTSVSRLEHENDELKTQLARMRDENRSFEERLVQEQLHNGEITAKLDNVRNVLRDQGYGGPDADLDAPIAGHKTLPAGRATPPKRRAPAAQISRTTEADDDIPPIRIDDTRPRGRTTPARSKGASPDKGREADSVGFNEEDLHWTPIARGAEAPDSPKR